MFLKINNNIRASFYVIIAVTRHFDVCNGVVILKADWLPFSRAAEVVKQYPNVMVMVDHCGLPYEKDEASTKLWKEGTMCV